MRRWLFTVSCLPFFALADQQAPIPAPDDDSIRLSSALNIPTPVFETKNYRFDGFYVGGEVGAAMPSSNMDESFDTGFDIMPKVGYQWDQFRFDITPMYISNGAAQSGVSALDLYVVTGNIYFDVPYSAIPINPRLTPVFGMGVGYFGTGDGSGGNQRPISGQWSYQAIGGLAYRLTLNWYINFTYHYLSWTNGSGSMNLFNFGADYHFGDQASPS